MSFTKIVGLIAVIKMIGKTKISAYILCLPCKNVWLGFGLLLDCAFMKILAYVIYMYEVKDK